MEHFTVHVYMWADNLKCMYVPYAFAGGTSNEYVYICTQDLLVHQNQSITERLRDTGEPNQANPPSGWQRSLVH